MIQSDLRRLGRRAVILASAALLLAAPAALAQERPPKPSNEPQDFLKDPPKPTSIKDHFTLVTIGDLLYSHPSANSPDPELQKVLQIVRSGDVTIANREGMFFDLKTFTGHNAVGGLWSEAALGPDMKAMGVDMVSLANNHSTDWGWEALLESERLLDEVGIAHAGGGHDLKEAREAGFLDTPKGRVGLVATAATFKTNAGAEDAYGEAPSRPGISTLRTRIITYVTPGEMADIRKLATELASPLKPAPKPDSNRVTFGGQTFQVSDKKGLGYEMDLYDHAGLLKAVKDAKAKSDLVVFTIHAHESTTGDDDDTPPPPDFLVTLFHNCVDAGADVILGGGPHSLRGIEIYKGKPIFYGIGVFFINGEIIGTQEGALHSFPDATGHAPPPRPPSVSVREGGNPTSWYDGLVPVTEYENGKAKTIRLYPLDLGNTYDRTRRGIPHLADPANAQRILAHMQEISAPFGTKIAVEGNVGVIRIP